MSASLIARGLLNVGKNVLSGLKLGGGNVFQGLKAGLSAAKDSKGVVSGFSAFTSTTPKAALEAFKGLKPAQQAAVKQAAAALGGAAVVDTIKQ